MKSVYLNTVLIIYINLITIIMAIIQNPIIGRAKGSFAGGVFYTMNGQNQLRAKNPTPNVSYSPAAVAQRNRHRAAVKFYQKNRTAFDSLLKVISKGMSAFNKFMSLNIMLFDDVTESILAPNVPALKFAIGGLDDVKIVQFNAQSGMHYVVEVALQPNTTKALPTDTLRILQYNESTGLMKEDIVLRSALSGPYTGLVAGEYDDIIHLFVQTVSNNLTIESNTVYVGQIIAAF